MCGLIQTMALSKNKTLQRINMALTWFRNREEYRHMAWDKDFPNGHKHRYDMPRIKELSISTRKEFMQGVGATLPVNVYHDNLAAMDYVAIVRIKHTDKAQDKPEDDTSFAFGFGETPKGAVNQAYIILADMARYNKNTEEVVFLEKMRDALIVRDPNDDLDDTVKIPNDWKKFPKAWFK